jgi:uncharacterized membrane protein
MTLIVPLEPKDDAKLMAMAQERGMSADQLVREAIHKILAEAPEPLPAKERTRSLRGLLAKYGPAPPAQEIEENRAEMLIDFPRSDL